MMKLSSPTQFLAIGIVLVLALSSGPAASDATPALAGAVTSLSPSTSLCDSSSQTCTLTPLADSYVNIGNPNLNYGASPSLLVESGIRGGNVSGTLEVSYLKFNLTAIPNGDGVLNAKLSLHLTAKSSTATSSIALYAVPDSSWGELTVTWNNAPPLSSSIIAVNKTVAVTGLNYTWDATNAFRQLTPALTLALVSQLNSGRDTFASKDSTQKPTLTIKYGPVTDKAPPTISGIGITPSVPTTEDLISVRGTVTDDTTISSVTLSYTLNSSSPITTPMSLLGNETYSATLPRQSSGSIMLIVVSAIDVAGFQQTAPPFSFTVQKPGYYYALQSKYNQLALAIQNMSSAFDSLQKNYTAIFQSNAANAALLSSLQTSYGKVQQQYNTLLDSYNSLNADSSSLKAKLGNVTASFAALSLQYSAAREALSRNSSVLSPLTAYAIGATILAAAVWALLAYVTVIRKRVRLRA